MSHHEKEMKEMNHVSIVIYVSTRYLHGESGNKKSNLIMDGVRASMGGMDVPRQRDTMMYDWFAIHRVGMNEN